MPPAAGAPMPTPQPVNQPPMGYPSVQPTPQPGPAPADMNQPAPTPPGRFSLKSKTGAWMFAIFFALVGGITTYLIFAQGGNGVNYYWYRQRYQETYWDGQVHTNPMECLTKQFICHDNGTLVFTGGLDRVWQSDSKKNNSDTKLKSATWYGPYEYSSGPYYSYGFGITGQQQACFKLKDVSAKGTAARLTFQIQNEKAYGQTAKVLLTLQGNLSADFKNGFKSVCIPYVNPYDAYAQQYRVYVQKGSVQIDYVDHLTQYYTYDYNPYPYPYDQVARSLKDKSPSTQKYNAGVICSATLNKSTDQCLGTDDLNKAGASKAMTDTQINPTGVTAD